MGDENGFRVMGIALPWSVALQLIVMVFGIVGAWYAMRLQLDHITEDLHTFVSVEHAKTIARVDTIEQRQQDVRERLATVESRLGDNRERISALEQRTFGFNRDSIDQSDERWHKGGRAYKPNGTH